MNDTPIDNNGQLMPEEVATQPLAVVQVPPVILEIFAHCKPDDMDEMMVMLKKIQLQLDKPVYQWKVRILYLVDTSERTEEQIQAWFMENCNCKYFIYANNANWEVDDDFVKINFKYIAKLDAAMSALKGARIQKGIVRKSNETTKLKLN